ncbi:MAG: proteasome accessory factor PafA2 family protein [Candidatus Poribacteria bacterium]|nr:proteasome accessory factor PafA2 family protein [Candidatus Poribacteria bacterium]
MKRRIFGLENEYGIICSADRRGGKALPIQNAVMYLFREIISGRLYPDVFLENGARFYQDIGCHPEYATPECDDVRELVMHDRAGERIIESLAHSAEKKMRQDGFLGRISVFKNNTDTPGNTYGCHENYLMDRSIGFRQMATQLIPFFVTRQAFCGAGKVRPSNRGKFAISQRAQHIREDISIAKTTARGIINTRDEPHADREKYRRLHVIVGDSNMSEFVTYLKVGATALILQMIEDNALDRRLELRESVRAIMQISDDLDCKREIELQSGKKMTAVAIQREYWNLAEQYFQRETDPFIRDVLKKWDMVLAGLEDDPESLDGYLDWVTKRRILETYVESRKLDWDSHEVLRLDLEFHNIDTSKGIFYRMEKKGLIARVCADDEIEHAMRHPPETTRAKFRGRFVKLANERKILCGVNWSYIQLYEPYQKLFLSTDPLQPDYDEANRMIYSM